MSTPEDREPSLSAAAVGGAELPSMCSGAATTSDASGEDPEPPGVAPTGAPVDALTVEEQLEAYRKEAADNFERFVRAKADIENIVKRHQRELAERARYDGEALARDVLQAVDDLERALEHEGDAGSGVLGGVELVLKGLLAALKRNGVEKIDALGKPFDPAEHEAVTMIETPAETPPNTVVAVLRAGYKMRDRLLRAAMVSVSRAPEAKA